jgi:histone H3/H4
MSAEDVAMVREALRNQPKMLPRWAFQRLAARLQEAERERDTALEALSEYRTQFNRWSDTEGPAREAALREALERIAHFPYDVQGNADAELYDVKQIAVTALATDPESEEAPE